MSASPVEGQPQFASCWRVPANVWFDPRWRASDKPHPAVSIVPRLVGPMLTCSVRSTLDPEDDTYAVFTPKNCTPNLDKDGWILCQFRQPILGDHFQGFTSAVFKGQLQEPYVSQIREKIKLPKL